MSKTGTSHGEIEERSIPKSAVVKIVTKKKEDLNYKSPLTIKPKSFGGKHRLCIASKPPNNPKLQEFLIHIVNEWTLFESLNGSTVGFICSDIPDRDVYISVPKDWSCAHWKVYSLERDDGLQKIWLKNEMSGGFFEYTR